MMISILFQNKHQHLRSQVEKNKVFYSAIPGIKSNMLKSLVDNMALTLRLHPWSLLIEAEEIGKVSLGTGITLTLDLITNLAQAAILAKERGMEAVFANYECHERRTLNRDRVYGFPLRIMQVKNPKETGIRALIVVEHRTLPDNFTLVQDILGTGKTRLLDMNAEKLHTRSSAVSACYTDTIRCSDLRR